MKLIFTSLVLMVVVAANSSAAVLAGPITNSANGHIYFLLTPTNYPNAEREAISLGGHLATINDAVENAWIFYNFAPTAASRQMHLIIGLNDFSIEGTHQWANGENSTYRNWAANEPNNGNGGEDGVMMYSSGGGAAQWNDFTKSTMALGIVELIPGTASQVMIRNAVEIEWTTQTTNRYQIQWSSELATNDWKNLGGEVQGNGSTCRIFDSVQSSGQKYYRVITIP